MSRIYAAIDLKSFYASAECVDLGLDPLTTNLVVADPSRTDKTICLAVSPALKSFGIPGRARLFEVVAKIRDLNAIREMKAPQKKFSGYSSFLPDLNKDPSLAIDYIIAPPRMNHYMKMSGEINAIYQQFISPDDIHVYSIDEVFIDLTDYLKTYALSPRDLTVKLIREVLKKTGITATAGIGSNLYLAKIAMDIEAKHAEPDKDGVRIAQLDEISYRKKLWNHRPLTDFWRVGKGISKKLAEKGLYTMGDIAKCSVGNKPDYYSEEMLYELFGVNAELLIDHAWGWEPCTITDIKAYKSENNSISSGQVLKEPYRYEDVGTVIREMTDALILELVDHGLQTDQVSLEIVYDIVNLDNTVSGKKYHGTMKKDFYGRLGPKSTHGSANLPKYTSSGKLITEEVMGLFHKITDKDLFIRRIYLTFNRVIPDSGDLNSEQISQLTFFDILSDENIDKDEAADEKENRLQKTVLKIQKKFGRNSLIKGMSLMENATQMERNELVGGHKS